MPRARSRWVLGLLGSLALAGGLGCASEDGDRVDCASFRFDAARWAEATRDEEEIDGLTAMQRLADALVTCDTLIGMPWSEVRRIFGVPDERGRRRLEYGIGVERGPIRMHGEYLDIRFGSDLRVSAAFIDG